MIISKREKRELFIFYFASGFSSKENELCTGNDRTKMTNRHLISKISKELVRESMTALDEFRSPGSGELHPQGTKEVVDVIDDVGAIRFGRS